MSRSLSSNIKKPAIRVPEQGAGSEPDFQRLSAFGTRELLPFSGTIFLFRKQSGKICRESCQYAPMATSD
jgi:hypothetical protein